MLKNGKANASETKYELALLDNKKKVIAELRFDYLPPLKALQNQISDFQGRAEDLGLPLASVCPHFKAQSSKIDSLSSAKKLVNITVLALLVYFNREPLFALHSHTSLTISEKVSPLSAA